MIGGIAALVALVAIIALLHLGAAGQPKSTDEEELM